MTRHLIFTVLLALTACSPRSAIIVITNDSPENQPVTVRMTKPVDNSFSFIGCDTITVENSIEIEIPLHQPCPIFIQELQKPGIYMIPESGKKYDVRFDGKCFRVINDIAQKKYNSIPLPIIETSLIPEAQKYASVTTTTELQEMLGKIRKEETAPFDSLLADGKISRKVHKAICTERDIYWRGITANVAHLHFIRNGSLSEDDHIIWKSAFEDIDLNDPELRASRYYRALAESKAEYNMFGDPDLDMDKLYAEVEAGRLHSLYIGLYKEFLDGSNLEYMIADRLFTACFQKDYSRELIGIFEDFRKDFPMSSYMERLEQLIEPVKKFHHKAELEEEGIEILENGPDAGSLEALAAMFKGKKVYVDVWATWCAPCKEEFKYASHLHGILTEMGYETLYISIDEERNDERWRDMIKGFGLKGKHIRADHRLMDDLYRIYGSSSMAIPWNMILDEEGHIKEKFAKRPSEILPEDL